MRNLNKNEMKQVSGGAGKTCRYDLRTEDALKAADGAAAAGGYSGNPEDLKRRAYIIAGATSFSCS